MAPHRVQRAISGAVISTLAVVAVGLASAPAGADPLPPQNTSDALTHLRDVSNQAEILTEQWKSAQEALDGKRQELAQATRGADQAKAAADEARAQQRQYQGKVDTLADVSFQGGRLNQLSAFLVSTSPQDFLDRASALDVLARNNNAAIGGLSAAVAKTGAEETRTKDAQGRARQAADDANRLAGDVAQRAQDMGRQVDAAKAALAALTQADRQKLAGPGPPSEAHPPKQGPGGGGPATQEPTPPASGAGAVALRAALGKIGSSYVWGAKGPSTFDCSGLVYWAYQQAGIAIGGSTSTQVSNGISVSRSNIQPGDLVFFYSPVHHVGIAVDGNRVVHAPDFGQTVKISPIDAMPFDSARRVTG